jgi:mono/diheme cytochrome c family protein
VGKMEFQSSCAACHGSDGRGKGPISAELKVPPADLTALAKRNNGVFPVSAVYELIYGKKSVSVHGPRDMPIWGSRYIPSVKEWLGQPSGSGNTEFVVQGRILALVDYLNRMQEK